MARSISKVYLMNTPLEDDLRNTLWFENATAQHNYFADVADRLGGREYTNVSYQSETRTFRCPDKIDEVRKYNYIMWQNPAYSNKWFYAFIKNITYISDGYTDIVFEVDPLQTWMFDIAMRSCFVEREHTNNDSVGANTLPENVELGPMVKNENAGTTQIGPGTMLYCVGVSQIIGNLSHKPSSNINGLPNGLYYIFTDNVTNLHNIVDIYDDAGKANAIYNMFVVPKEILNRENGGYAYQTSTWKYDGNTTHAEFNVYTPTSNNLVGTLATNKQVPVPTKVGVTYTPRNKKLLTFPYCYFNISNNSGTTVTYHYEDFNGTPTFDLVGVLNVGCSTKLYPKNYKNMTFFSGDVTDNPYDFGVTGGKYPTISWNSDSFTNWLTQNAVNVVSSAASYTLATVGNLALGNVAGATASMLGGVTNAISQVYEASLVPDQARGNTNVGDLNYTAHKNRFTVFPMSIKPEYAKVIDDYFDMFGYKCCRVKYPNTNHRQNWWYTKTINANIVGDIPNDDLNKIKEAYNNGITYWRNPANFMSYDVSNGVI